MSSTTEPQQSAVPSSSSASPRPNAPSSSSYLSYPVAHVVSGLYRRLTEPSIPSVPAKSSPKSSQPAKSMNGVYTPPNRTASPFQPPPLTPLTLRGVHANTSSSAQILSRALAEEIRLLVPPRLQLVDDWTLAYSVEQDGVSLATLYAKCDAYRGKRSGFVLVVRDGAGGVSSPPPTCSHSPPKSNSPRSSAPTSPTPPTRAATTTARANVSSGASPSSPRPRSSRPSRHLRAPTPRICNAAPRSRPPPPRTLIRTICSLPYPRTAVVTVMRDGLRIRRIEVVHRRRSGYALRRFRTVG